ncbi:hypothetical protein F2Q70_00029133 [Brassica cretica]|uniref:Uncharacterized protein n=1 Tax=Brassica cretica TaxID=69181 RepID=A0A3N6T9Y3_BRACR|nr:hypothetical protein F2Q70_00029133 [Brassica cretica]KAF3591118.1 hypothetical protein DY000_02020313 [Brassica cretica]
MTGFSATTRKRSFCTENGLELAKVVVDKENHSLDGEGMDLDETETEVEFNEEFLCGDEEFHNLTDGEVEETFLLQEDSNVALGVTIQAEELGDKETAIGDG